VVDDQREAVRRLAGQAKPIVDFLSSRMSSDRVQRWAAIVGEVATFDQKRPGNALSALEAVMRDGIPAMVPERGCGLAAGSATAGTGIFESVRKDLVDEGLRQCVEVRYANIAAEFNRRLSSRFPFSRSVDATSEATREAVAQFLRLYDQQGGRFLASLLTARSCRADASAFVGHLDKAYALLTSTAPIAPGSPAPTSPEIALDVAPEFRVARGLDNGGSQISEWQLDIAHQNIREHTASKPGTWTSGDVVSVQVRFARDSPNRPVSNEPSATPAGVRVTVRDRTVRWDFEGDWALFRLLRAGHLVAAGLAPSQELPPIVLGFQIPVERDTTHSALIGQAPESPFSVYMRIAVSPKDKALPLYVEDFPYEAPVGAVCPGL
jgi:type VI secretion system protein ImpL